MAFSNSWIAYSTLRLRQAVEVVLPAQVEVVGLGIDGLALRQRDLLGEAELELQRLDDLLGDLLLDVEDVVELALVGVAPDLAIGRDIDELHRDAHRVLEACARCRRRCSAHPARGRPRGCPVSRP